MKIEMGESLCASWLRHVKGCQVVQTNWSNSPTWESWNDGEYQEKIEKLFDAVSASFKSKYPDYDDVFKKNSLQTLLKQSECDDFGICIEKDRQVAYGVDVVFHKNGFIYTGDLKKDIPRVIKKCARTAMSILLYTGINEVEIIFASPIMMPTHYDKLKPAIDDLNSIMRECGFTYNMRLIANDDFKNEIALPLLKVSENINDDNELFLRSWQLAEIFSQEFKTKTVKHKIHIADKPDDADADEEVMPDNTVVIKGETFRLYRRSGEKIQDFVRSTFERLLNISAISDTELKRLHDKEYCLNTFGLQFALFVDTEKERSINGHDRYYAKRTGKFFLCSQWWLGKTSLYDDKITDWLTWLSEKGMN